MRAPRASTGWQRHIHMLDMDMVWVGVIYQKVIGGTTSSIPRRMRVVHTVQPRTASMLIDNFRSDLRFAFRSLRRAPGFTVVALATLVIGIASVTALFSLVYGYAFRPLPYKDASRIVALQERRPTVFFGMRSVSIDAARAVIAGARSFERTSLYD